MRQDGILKEIIKFNEPTNNVRELRNLGEYEQSGG